MDDRRVAKSWQSIVVAAAILTAAASARAEESCEAQASPNRLTVRVEGVKSAEGLVAVTLYPDEAGRFMASRGRIARVRVPAAKGTVAVCVPLPGAGHYAVFVYHDQDGDRRMDRSLVGLPTEGWGFSNNPANLTGLPAFERVRFEAKAGSSSITVHLSY